ncbi:hypothetical protein C1645_826373 [Glomus cerebriforme]|uniref:Uncharacterized protein n=1 Tax=Glomus cerebriforme TaxID=658196 RepID=A0A397T027_9GLOM|nr:hypothetical protein C1645_826373 [Glomus cerebriforme]
MTIIKFEGNNIKAPKLPQLLSDNFAGAHILEEENVAIVQSGPDKPNKARLLKKYGEWKLVLNYYKHQLSDESLEDEKNQLKLKNKRLHNQTKKLIRRTKSLGASWALAQSKITAHIRNSLSIWLATSIAQAGEISIRSTIECTKLIYGFLTGDLHKIGRQPQHYALWSDKKQSPIVFTASLKDIPKCNSETVSNVVIQSIQENGLDITKYILWVTDNTAYMSSDKNGAVSLFNKKSGINAFRIGCGLHIVQIIFNHFEQKAFGKIYYVINKG